MMRCMPELAMCLQTSSYVDWMSLQATRSKDGTPVKQRPKALQPVCPPNSAAKGFTLGRGRPHLPPTGVNHHQAPEELSPVGLLCKQLSRVMHIDR